MRGAPPDQESSSSSHAWVAPSGEGAIRLDAFVRRCLPHLSLRQARKAIDEKSFWINGRPAKKGDKLFGGDLLSFRGAPHLLALAPPPGRDLHVPVLYEDECVLVIDKPAGMAAHGFSGREKHSLANFLVAIRPALASVGKSRWEPGLVHRLDRDTSGLVLVAKDQKSFEDLRSQFRRGLIQKKYWALVWGKAEREKIVDYPLIHGPKDRGKMRAVKNRGEKTMRVKKWRAITHFKPVASSGGFTLLEVEIETGVTHQIRAHLEASGYPVVGDPLYGNNRPDPFALGHQFLHAYYLGFRHPKSGLEVAVTSPLPEELKRILDCLQVSL